MKYPYLCNYWKYSLNLILFCIDSLYKYPVDLEKYFLNKNFSLLLKLKIEIHTKQNWIRFTLFLWLLTCWQESTFHISNELLALRKFYLIIITINISYKILQVSRTTRMLIFFSACLAFDPAVEFLNSLLTTRFPYTKESLVPIHYLLFQKCNILIDWTTFIKRRKGSRDQYSSFTWLQVSL